MGDQWAQRTWSARSMDGKQVIIALIGDDRFLLRVLPNEPAMLDREEFFRFAAGVVFLRERAVRGEWEA